MQPRHVAELPEGDGWLYEIKWDGYRALAIKHGDEVRLVSRNEKDLTKQFPALVTAVRSVAADTCVLDGEIVAFDENNRPSFQALQNQKTEASRTVFFAFDLLHLNGKDLHPEPLEWRKAALAKIVEGSNVLPSGELMGDARDIAAEARKMGLEGIVAKRRSGTYARGESGDWVKLKLNREQEFVVGGFVPPVNKVQALVIGYYDKRRLICCGRVRNGFFALSRAKLAALLKPLQSENCSFANLPMDHHGRWGEGITAADMEEMRWLTPAAVVQIAFVEWTRAGLLRHPTFRGIRHDKNAAAVRKEVDE